ncbi:hypothetical protein TGGT1_277860 [Toxoplasma gondii GT1]|uniref:Uncharacterized protein n=4 Tax=Toxoplasma gondii TaxID=5811 RepID=S7WFY4_TOXGG|nr:hypothetical protein TGGT1_277860 [Toxoplasma gondii GT1]
MAALQPPPPHASSSPSFSPAPASASRCVSSSLVVPQDSRQPRALRLLCWFLCHNEYNDFRFEELEALAEAEGVSKAFLWGGEKARESSPTPKPVSYPPSPLTAANAAAGGGPSCSLSFPPASLLASPLASPSPPPPSMCSSPSAPPLPSPFGSPLLPTSSASSPPPLSSLAPNALPAFSAPPNVLAEASPPTSPVLRVPPSSPCSSPAFSWTVSAPAPAAPLAACRPEEASRKQFVYCHFPSEEAACRILEKSILVRAFIEVWAEGETYEEVMEQMQRPENLSLFRRYVNDRRTWSFRVKAFGKSLSVEEQREKMNFFAPLFSGKERVSLEHPDVTLALAEEWVHASEPGDRPAEKPLRIFLGREIASRHADKTAQPWWWHLRLSRRPVLGPTSLDVELAFLMCHQAHVKRGTLVLDPFVGTGSILISASYYGATCVGSDIDIRVLKGYSVAYLNPHIKHPPNGKTYGWPGFERKREEAKKSE